MASLVGPAELIIIGIIILGGLALLAAGILLAWLLIRSIRRPRPGQDLWSPPEEFRQKGS